MNSINNKTIWFKIKLQDDSFIKINNNIKINNKIKINDSDNTSFDKLWELKPLHKPILNIYGKKIEAPRYFQNYGADYYFSGKLHSGTPVPIILQPYLDYVNKLENKLENKFNNVLVNFYEDNNQYISYHSDNEKNIKKNSNIYCFSFGAERMFYIKNNETKLVQKYKLLNNSCIIMGNSFQKYYTHSIPKTSKIFDKRISITIRCFI
jgi:alkylated DNA repair dioxygenase AlkB